MHDSLLIRAAEEITRDWAAAVLQQAGLLADRADLAGIALETLSGAGPGTAKETGKGFMSLVVRVRLTYAAPAAAAPASLVVKLPPPGAERFALGASMQLFLREMEFYRSLAGSTPIAVPTCFYAGGDPASGAAAVVLEDAAGWQLADQIAGLTQAQAETVVDMVAAMHARWWAQPELRAHDWLPDSPWGRELLFRREWPGFLERYRAWLSEADIRVGDSLAAGQERLQEAMGRAPPTLVQGDVRADNLLVEGPDPDRPILLLDWQVLSRGMGAVDPARLVSGSLEMMTTAAHYRAYADRWYEGLLQGGVAGYARADAWRHFRLGLLHALHVPICFHANISHEGAAGQHLMAALVRRMFRAVGLCRAWEALDES